MNQLERNIKRLGDIQDRNDERKLAAGEGDDGEPEAGEQAEEAALAAEEGASGEPEEEHEDKEEEEEEEGTAGLDTIPGIKEHVQTKQLVISNKKDLKNYLTGSFAQMFFTPRRYVQ